MSQPQKLHLFNCDRTYKLDAVEDLLAAMKAKLRFDSVERHYFSIAQMSEMTKNIIPKLEMDMAFFAVHAHESRLSINEDNAGIGYAKIYRALLEATEGQVIIIIGGDDNYRSEDEEDGAVISRWAKRKISSQFSEEFLDGRKSFIFSWNKKHREIHEEALLHYFDPSKKGRKFEYQPKPKQPETSGVKSAQNTSEKTLSRKYQSMDEQRRREGIGSSNSSSAEQRRQNFASGRSYSDGQTSKHSSSDRSNDSKPREDDNEFSHSNSTELRRNGSLYSYSRDSELTRVGDLFSDSTDAAQRGDNRSLSNPGVHHVQRPLPKRTEDLAILCCHVSEDSMHAVIQLLHKIVPKLNLSTNPPVENLLPNEIKKYLTEVHLNACVLVVDGKTVEDAYKNVPQQKEEYRELLETAANRVVEKVIILVCDNCSLPPKDEEIVSQTIEEIVIRTGKVHYAWLKNGRLSVEPDVLVKCLMSTPRTPQPSHQTNPFRASQEKNRDARDSAAESFSTSSGQSQSDTLQRNPPDWKQGHSYNVPNMQQPTQQATTKTQPYHPPAATVTAEPVLLRSLLHNGVISYQLDHLQLRDPSFTVPDYINQELSQQCQDTTVTGVTIVRGTDGKLRWYFDPKLIEVSKSRYEGIQIADNETLLLKTRIFYGQASLQESDVHFRHETWQIPQYIVKSLHEEYWATPKGLLYIISDDRENLRQVVKVGTISRARTFFKRKGF